MILIDGGYIENGKYYYYLTDHLGNNRVVADAKGNIVQKTHYEPFGKAFEDGEGLDKQPYLFGGKEFYAQHGLELYDSAARWYDPDGWLPTPDPHAENYYSWSPYHYAGNNPMRITDPTGMDWFVDKDGSYQFNKDLNEKNQADILKEGQSYLGLTAQINDSEGNSFADFRSDGSIMFANEGAAYGRAITNTMKTGNEEAVAILEQGALVMNTPTRSKWNDYGYTFEKGNLKDPISGNTLDLVGTAHTHPNGEAMSGYGGDLGFAIKNTPGKPVFAFMVGGGYENSNLGNIQGMMATDRNTSKVYMKIPSYVNVVSISSIISPPSMSLRGFAKKYKK